MSDYTPEQMREVARINAWHKTSAAMLRQGADEAEEDGVRFQVGDWVRRKPAHQGRPWPYGDATVRVAATSIYHEIAVNDEWHCNWHPRFFDPAKAPATFDPHALGMALVLANELANECVVNHGRDYKADWSETEDRHGYVSDWLRACVTEELLSQEAE